MSSKSDNIFRRIYQRYLVEATSSMAYGLFASLIIGTILAQLGKFEILSFMAPLASVVQSAPVFGAVIGAAIASGLKGDPLVIFSSAGAGAIGCVAGGPVGAYVGGVIGAEIGQLVSKRTPVDIVVTPMVTILAGGLVSQWVGPYIQQFMKWLGSTIEMATELMPLPMGILVGVTVGMVLTLPISSAALCVAMELSGLAAGAAVAGCCAQMIGFAVTSFRDNGVSGLVSQGIGTSMLQVPNIMRRPMIWIAPTVAGAVCGGLSATLFKMQCDMVGAGMGTSGLVGQITTYAVMSPLEGPGRTLLAIAVLHFILPALVALAVDRLMLRIGWVRKGDMALQKI